MTPDEAANHEWLQPSSSSTTFILSSSTSASCIVKQTRNVLLKEYEQSHQQNMSKNQRSQPITPVTILPQIKTPNNQKQQGSSLPQQRNGMTNKDGNKIKGKQI